MTSGEDGHPSSPPLEALLPVLARGYLDGLQDRGVVAAAEASLAEYLGRHARLLRVERLVYERREEKLTELLNVYSSLDGLGVSVVLLVVSDGSEVILCLGVVSPDASRGRVHLGRQVLSAAMRGNFPGSEIRALSNSEAEQLLRRDVLGSPAAVAAITGLPSRKDEAHAFVQGLDRYLDAMRGRKFAVLAIAEPVAPGTIAESRRSYCDLHTYLGLLATQQINLQSGTSESLSETEQRTLTRSFSHAVATTQTTTTTRSTSVTRPTSLGYVLAGIGAVVGGALGGPAASLTGAAGAHIGMALGGSKTTGANMAHGRADNEAVTEGAANATMRGASATVGTTETVGRSWTYDDAFVRRAQRLVEMHIRRLDDGERYGFWNTGIYFAGPDEESVTLGTSLLRGLLTGEASELERPRVHLWTKDNEHLPAVAGSLRRLQNPSISARGISLEASGLDAMHPTTLLSSKDLALVMGLPEHSAPGLTVHRSASFGRQVTRESSSSGATVDLGGVYHLGAIDQRVRCKLDLASLSSHVFITGTTGAGKTRATKALVASLAELAVPIPTLVIEPAKREYAALDGCTVGGERTQLFAATPRDGRLLRLDPFAFPCELHVYEHIDRLVQVFNAAFPMYASMPALLEEGIRRAYRGQGWNLSTSTTNGPRRFPSLRDLERELAHAVDEAGYSEQLRADFHGALVTRIRSLSRGIRGEVLCPLPGRATSSEELFDRPCVVNLAALGNPETKALVTALLIMKLYSHREATSGATGPAHLRHVTIVEEAHHLLRGRARDQGDESADLGGLAVETFSNAIAELRAYGEGIVLVDQSVDALDHSVLRNTNTKIAFRLPFAADRQAVGSAMGATPEQIAEMARLPTGVAAVYQNEWLQPVLCQISSRELPPVELDQLRGAELTSEQLAIVLILPALVPGDAGRLLADLLPPSRRLSDLTLELERALCCPGLAAALDDAYRDDSDPDLTYEPIVSLLSLPEDRGGHRPQSLVADWLPAQFGVSRDQLLELQTLVDEQEPERRRMIGAIFGRGDA